MNRRAPWLAAMPLTALMLASCGGADGADGQDETPLIVTSIDVYADLAEHIVGDTAEVEAIVADTGTDPHSYEANAQDRLLVAEADVLIANGGGYDPYLTQLASSEGLEDDVFQLIDGENWHSHEYDGSYENEHIWYDLEQMSEFVSEFGDHMAELYPDHAELYRENAEDLVAEIDALDERNRAIEAEGMSFLSTESVSGFLLSDAGMEDLTEGEFLAAVEHGDDVSPRLFRDTLDTVSSGEADVLSYNPQTETNQALQIREAAEEESLQVLEFSETLPEGAEGYLDWMEQNIAQIEQAVQGASS